MWLRENLSIFWHSFQVRVFLALTLIIVIVIPGTGYFCYLQARRVAEKQMQQYALGTAVQISKRVESFLSHHTYNAKLIKSFFENDLINHSDDKEILRYLHLFQQEHPEFFNINFGDETGRFLMAPAQIPEVHKTFDPRVRPWYRGAIQTKDVHWTNVYLFASTQKPGMTVSVPIYDTAGAITAVCGIDIDISSFSRFLKKIKIGKQGFAYIFENKQGRVIAHPSLVQLPWNSYHIDLLRTCLTDLNQKNKTFGMSSFQGDRFFTAYTDYPGNDWTVGVTLPVSDFLENVKAIKQAIISLVIAGIFLSSFLSYLLAMTIVSPLNILKKGIERISSGDLEYKVNINDPDIASALAGSFNQMASSLEISTRELEKTYAELAQKEKLAAVGQMTAGIAHEIKNPLGIILGSAQVVSNSNRPMEMREKAADFIIKEVERLNKTLTAFLDFAKPASPNFQRIDITDLLEEILISTEERFAEKGYRIDRDFLSMAPTILADPDQIKEVFWNIFLNAMQSMPDGGTVTVKINIEKGKESIDAAIIPIKGLIQHNPDYLTVSIMDQGCGISDEQMEKILDPFVSFRDDGIGLGLSIVSQIIKSHKGQVKIESTPGKGTRFKLLFPLLLQENTHAS
ncbi:cache domain-containing protein [Desulfobacula sp.]|uniref:cache domain-containing protein n=1 Tax=Desulfobacula sp. TaxID=2593537 RepID=UPI0025C3A0C7|nr:cache domain-containing protein [Desulfobacula sp.]MBC2705284.1 Cache 3/Cache 2 fusion domain-containing protein [Desulfobacula sp.]